MSNQEEKFDIEKFIDCAVCGKKEISGIVCPRCESDLEILRKLIICSETLVLESMNVLSAMKPDESLQLAKRSWNLRKNQKAAKAAFLSCCALGDFENALRWYNKYLLYGYNEL
jgi:hypothetical protein